MKRNPLPLVLILILFLASLSCKALSRQSSRPEPTEASEGPVVKIATATSEEEADPTEAEYQTQDQPTSIPLPTATPVLQAESLVLSDVWFAHDIQSEITVWYAFFLENPNPDLAVVDSEFQVVAYDSSGAVLSTANLDVPLIFPGEKIGLVGYALNVPENTKVEKVEVQPVREGEGKVIDYPGNPMIVEKSTFYHTQYRKMAAGMIQNRDEDESLTNVAVSVIAYDGNNNVIGVGSSYYIPFVPANGSIGTVVDMQMISDDIPARLEFFPTFTYGWLAIKTSDQGVMVESSTTGFYQDEYETLTWAFIAQNPSADQAIQYANYQVTAFDETGNVVATSTGTISLLFPEEQLGVTSMMILPEDMKADKIEVTFAPQPIDNYDSWSLEELGLTENPLTAESVTYFDDPYSPKVTGIIQNSYGKEVNAEVAVLLYDAGGVIIGGGNTYVTIPANGQAAIEVYVQTGGEPDQIVIYPSLANPPSN